MHLAQAVAVVGSTFGDAGEDLGLIACDDEVGATIVATRCGVRGGWGPLMPTSSALAGPLAHGECALATRCDVRRGPLHHNIYPTLTVVHVNAYLPPLSFVA